MHDNDNRQLTRGQKAARRRIEHAKAAAQRAEKRARLWRRRLATARERLEWADLDAKPYPHFSFSN
jgi:hypothetical protein